MSNIKTLQAVKTSFDFAKDVASKNLIDYIGASNIKLSKNEIEKLLRVVELSIDESFQKTVGSIEKSLDRADKPISKKKSS